MGIWTSGVCNSCSASIESADLVEISAGYHLCSPCIKSIYQQVFGETRGVRTAKGQAKTIDEPPIDSPKEIKLYLDSFIIGQESAKKVLSVAVYNHYKRLSLVSTGLEIDKSNIMLIGPTGSGKTLLVKTIAKVLSVPFAIADATSLVQSGYVGESVDTCIKVLFENSGHSIIATQSGIVFIDEIDKIGKKAGVSGRDIAGEGVQQQLLKLIEGKEVTFDYNFEGSIQKVTIDTTNILFIVGGAFVSTMSIQNSTDVIQFGIIPEMVGRLPTLVKLQDHTVDSLVRIMTEPENSIIKQVQQLFLIDKVNLTFNKNALEMIAAMAIENQTGARGLRSIIDRVLLDVTFDIESVRNDGKFNVTKSCVEKTIN